VVDGSRFAGNGIAPAVQGRRGHVELWWHDACGWHWRGPPLGRDRMRGG